RLTTVAGGEHDLHPGFVSEGESHHAPRQSIMIGDQHPHALLATGGVPLLIGRSGATRVGGHGSASYSSAPSARAPRARARRWRWRPLGWCLACILTPRPVLIVGRAGQLEHPDVGHLGDLRIIQ